jgi:hypothetical protein
MADDSDPPVVKTGGRPFKPEQGRWKKGQSGNPKGRPPGPSKTTAFWDAVANDRADKIITAVLNAAQNGDVAAARLVLDRIWLPRRGRPLANIDLPLIDDPDDALRAMSRIIFAVGQGTITTTTRVFLSRGMVSGRSRAMAITRSMQSAVCRR